ncbi:MAG: PAS domain-containing protein [Waddliaceae bacterium]|jgi:PAS domain S-box-containing protein|nr:PAS domain-containing protein [Waddliaceae bacterium]MBT3578925.1 PAS domain-containing protein [Waddliaceae bacterium]MBT4445516.1 PAS domain-containing protein [Waddliaceae bacterium]MBT6929007.1 PAS domain-containing protein [Waddliaceae bacterium]MBT7264005.1 PAS domain-containing protein [Waddliaceae bacterium]
MTDKEKEQRNEWDETFDAIADLVFIQDKDFTITKANKALCDALKVKKEDIVGKKCYEVLHNRGEPWGNCPFKQTKEDGKAHIEEVDDPNIGIPLSVTTSPIFDEKGEVAGSIHIARNISEAKDAEKEIKKKVQDLESFQKVAVGREQDMIKMKKYIKELEEKLGEEK